MNPYICRLVGELCDGFHAHPSHSIKYLKENVLARIKIGAQKAGRSAKDIPISTTAFVIMGDSWKEVGEIREEVRMQIAFYASNKTYKPMLDVHGWGDTCARLSEKAAKGEWAAMAKEITDGMFEVSAVTSSPEEIPALLKEKYDGLLDRPGKNEAWWRKILEAFRC